MWKCSCSKQKTKPPRWQTCFTFLSCKRWLLTSHFQQTTASDVLWTKKALFSRSREMKSYGDGWKWRRSTEWAGRAGALLTTWKCKPKSFSISFFWRWSIHLGMLTRQPSGEAVRLQRDLESHHGVPAESTANATRMTHTIPNSKPRNAVVLIELLNRDQTNVSVIGKA